MRGVAGVLMIWTPGEALLGWGRLRKVHAVAVVAPGGWWAGEMLPGVADRQFGLKWTVMPCFSGEGRDLVGDPNVVGYIIEKQRSHRLLRWAFGPRTLPVSPSSCEAWISISISGSAGPESSSDLPSGHREKVEQQRLGPEPA